MTKEQKCDAIAKHEARNATEREVYNLLIDGCPALINMKDEEIDQLMSDYNIPKSDYDIPNPPQNSNRIMCSNTLNG